MNSTYFVNCVSGNVFNTKTTPALPTAYYIGLSTTTPSKDGSGVTEPSSSAGYKRVQITGLDEPIDGAVTNSTSISFDESTASWGTVTHVVIFDAATEGNLLMADALDPPRAIDSGTIMTIKDGYLTLKVADLEG